MNIIVMSLQVQTLLRLDTDFQASVLRVDAGIPMTITEQREFLHRGMDSTQYVLNTIGRHPNAQSSQASANAPSWDYGSYQSQPAMYPSTSTGTSYRYDTGAGPSHVSTGKLN